MHVRQLVLAALLVASGSTHAQFGVSPAMHPMAMMNPMTMMAPMGMTGMMGTGIGGMNPMAMAAPMGMMAAPMMMPMGASMMSAQMYQPQAMMNPYLNPAAASNPYLNPSAGRVNPFVGIVPPSAAPAPSGNPFDPAMWMQMMGGTAPPAR